MFILKIAGDGGGAVVRHGQHESWLYGGIVGRALRPSWVVIAGAAAYFAALTLLGIRLRQFVRRGAE